MDTLEYIEQERTRLANLDTIIKLQRENDALQFRADAAHEMVMQLHERVAQMEIDNDDTTERLRRHLIQILFCSDDDREYWQNYYREHLPDEVAKFEATTQLRGFERGS
jgi:uncharacterized protein YtpQ (UPF0354 family)